ncbi:hypothetical protein EHV15_35575 [Paenibacillus oralis]|uniref:Uncharacterized protein n=1 Tax=Paenibacillus oralis TaxID=2490856 RepID=A0A3P3TBJ5_9BACL|nr:hypothetical protein [Paenibacillus oralis]RRJ54894.1 hypothetical protein EHV15_35575 [Paenibacillus oralis]
MEPNNDISRKKNVIIAIPTPAFADGLRKHFENEGLNVLEVCVVVDHLLEKLHELKSEPSIKLDGIVISSAIATKLSDKRLEFLADVVEKIRDEFSETSIIFLSDESQGHPLLAELVSMGIYNIFVKSAQKSEPLNIKQLIRCIDQSMLYHEVKKYRNYDTGIPWRRSFVNGGHSITINIEGQGKEKTTRRTTPIQDPDDTPTPVVKEISKPEFVPDGDGSRKQSEKQETKTNKPQKFPDILEEELEDHEFLWQLPPIIPKVIVRDRIVGKSIIAVAGIEKGAGTTHTSVLIANYLAGRGYSVKLIECNGSKEFVYIERAYEGKNVNTQKTDEFEINGVTYVKASSELDMAYHVTSDHSHIVLDMGPYEHSDFIEEFHRAGRQFLVAQGSEWKQYTIKRFIQTNRSVDQSRWIFLIPLVDKQTISDIRGENEDIAAYKLPFHPDPFECQTDTDEEFNQLFDGRQATRLKMARYVAGFCIGLLLVGIIFFFIFR